MLKRWLRVGISVPLSIGDGGGALGNLADTGIETRGVDREEVVPSQNDDDGGDGDVMSVSLPLWDWLSRERRARCLWSVSSKSAIEKDAILLCFLLRGRMKVCRGRGGQYVLYTRE